MTVIKVVQHGPTVDINSAVDTQSTAFIVNSGILRLAVDGTKSAAHFEFGGNPSAVGSSLHVSAGDTLLVKVATPKRSEVIGVTQGAVTTILNVDQDGRRPSHPFKVGDYVTLSGAAVGAYNTGIAHLAITAVTDTTISVALNSSGYAAFTGTATLKNSIKYAILPDTSSGAKVNVTEVQVVGG